MRMRDKIAKLEHEKHELYLRHEKLGLQVWDLKNDLKRQGVCPFMCLMGNEEKLYIPKTFEYLKRRILDIKI